MIDLIIWSATAYLAIGAVFSVAVVVMEWYHGENITLGDLRVMLVRTLLWPVGVMLWLEDRLGHPIGNVVLFRGRRSARALRALRGDGD